MDQFDVDEATSHFARLLDRVEGGEEIIISRAGRPIARLVPYKQQWTREPGAWQGRVDIAPDFDTLPPEVARAFRGEEG